MKAGSEQTKREEFEKDADTYGYNLEKAGCGCCDYFDRDTEHRWRGFEAATEASDAKWQARVKELEEALKANHKWHQDNDEYEGYGESDLCELNCKALSTTSPDQALQRVILEARIDENQRDPYDGDRHEELRKQREEIGG